MLPYVVAFGVLLHVLFWGAGLAALVMPQPWRPFWPILAAPAGLALQSLAVWVGAQAGLPGTQAYAWPAELIPLLLLVAGLRRRADFGWREISRFAGVGLIMAACLATMVRPLTRAASGLTTVSLGNCDAADYAAGARVLQEFARHDRTGFLGLTEVVRVMSVDNFFDFWLKLNHFTPSALIALNGTIFHCAPYELTGLATMAFFAAALPVVFWIARALLRYGTPLSLVITGVFGLSPVMLYAVDQVAIGQLLALPALALLAWAGTALWRGPFTVPGLGRFAGVLAVAYALILGSYNFIAVVCVLPAMTLVGLAVVRTNRWREAALWLLGMLLPLVGVGVIFWERVSGLVERFQLFRAFDFGWKIPGFSPDGWLGALAGPSLAPIGAPWHLLLALGVILALAEALLRGAQRGDRRVVLVLSFTLPILFGYAVLLWRGARLGTNASYDAYKLFAVFYGLLLPCFCYWVTLGRKASTRLRLGLWLLALGLLAGNVRAAYRFSQAEAVPPLVVDRDLLDIRKLETMIGIDSVNLRLPDMWSRLWANAFLLHKAQYFPTHTYEGRRNTPLHGQWDLNGGGVEIALPDGGSQRLDGEYSLVNVGSPYYIRAELAGGWYDPERLPRTTVHWRWSGPGAKLRLENPQSRPLQAVLHFDARSLAEGGVTVWPTGLPLAGLPPTAKIGRDRAVVNLPAITIPPGTSEWDVRTDPPAVTAPGDTRTLGLAVYGLQVEILRDK